VLCRAHDEGVALAEELDVALEDCEDETAEVVVVDTADVEVATLVEVDSASAEVVAALVSVAAAVVLVVAAVSVVAAPAVFSGGVSSSGGAAFAGAGLDFPNGFKSSMPFSMSPPRPFAAAPRSSASPAASDAGISGTSTLFLNPRSCAMVRGTFVAGADVFPAGEPATGAAAAEQVSVFRFGKAFVKSANLVHGS